MDGQTTEFEDRANLPHTTEFAKLHNNDDIHVAAKKYLHLLIIQKIGEF